MKPTETYIAKQRKCIKDNFRYAKSWKKDKNLKVRYEALASFIKPYKKTLSVGSGGAEPFIINSSDACDVCSDSGDYLKKLGWKGVFINCFSDDLIYPSRSFDAVVCSEVIEHLPTIQMVLRTIFEINRVGKRWLITTPNKVILDPGHVFFFTLDELKALFAPFKCTIKSKGIHYYISND